MVGQTNDPLEAEADRIADQVTGIPEPSVAAVSPQVSRKCSSCEEEDKEASEPLQAKRDAPGLAVGGAPSAVTAVLQSPGRPLEPGARGLMESRLGYDLGDVRIHTGQLASRSAEAVTARAYTVGCNVVFRQGEYAPDTTEGRRLLAHELVHVLQQRPAQSAPQQLRPSQVAAIGGLVQRQEDASQTASTAASRQPDEITASSSVEAATSGIPLTDSSQIVGQMAALTGPAAASVGGQRLCFPPSMVDPTSQWASGFGALAERYIEQDFCANSGLSCIPGPAGTVYIDNYNPTEYRDFLVTHNPSLLTLSPAAKLAAYVAGGIQRPDILSDDGVHKEYYEIKPLSPSGAAAGVEKLAFIASFMAALKLPYIAGTTYSPSKDIPIMSGAVLGEPLAVSLNVQRWVPGIVTYSLCLSGNLVQILAKVALAALLAWIAAQILAALAAAAAGALVLV